jgi:two-component system phosphate regulon sensor histidine kinase PhoR
VTVTFGLVSDARGLITGTSTEAAAILAIEERWLVGKPLANFVSLRDRSHFRTLLLDLEHGRAETARCTLVLEPRRGDEVAAAIAATRRDGRIDWTIDADAELPSPDAPSAAESDGSRLLARVFARLPYGVVVVDRNLDVVFANPAARRAIAVDGAAGRAGDPLPDPWPDVSLREIARSLFGRHPTIGTTLVETGESIYAVEGLPAGNAPTATLLVEDVTVRERARRSERRFVENAAHELRTPVAAITSVVDVLESGAKDDPATRDSFLAHIRTHSDRLTRLATSLLVLARIQTGLEQPKLDLVAVAPLLEEIAQRLVPQKGVRVEVSAADDLAVLTDRDLLAHALMNIAANAARHTTRGSIALEGRDLGRQAEIEVRDTGAGMTVAESAQALDRFYRAERAGDRSGFGLGLAIADEALRALGGNIRLESKPGRGTRVRVSLPSARVMH